MSLKVINPDTNVIQASYVKIEGDKLSILKNMFEEVRCYSCLNKEAGVIS